MKTSEEISSWIERAHQKTIANLEEGTQSPSMTRLRLIHQGLRLAMLLNNEQSYKKFSNEFLALQRDVINIKRKSGITHDVSNFLTLVKTFKLLTSIGCEKCFEPVDSDEFRDVKALCSTLREEGKLEALTGKIKQAIYRIDFYPLRLLWLACTELNLAAPLAETLSCLTDDNCLKDVDRFSTFQQGLREGLDGFTKDDQELARPFTEEGEQSASTLPESELKNIFFISAIIQEAEISIQVIKDTYVRLNILTSPSCIQRFIMCFRCNHMDSIWATEFYDALYSEKTFKNLCTNSRFLGQHPFYHYIEANVLAAEIKSEDTNGSIFIKYTSKAYHQFDRVIKKKAQFIISYLIKYAKEKKSAERITARSALFGSQSKTRRLSTIDESMPATKQAWVGGAEEKPIITGAGSFYQNRPRGKDDEEMTSASAHKGTS